VEVQVAKQSKSFRPLLLTCVASLLLVALTAMPAHAGNWFVSGWTGSDANACNQQNLPCKTINGAIAKAMPYDEIRVTSTIYTSQAAEVVRVNKSLVLSGGWDLNFNKVIGYTILNGENQQRRGLFVEKGASVNMYDFAIVFCQANFGGGAYVEGSLLGFHMFIAGNRALGAGGGVFFNGRVGDYVGLTDSAVFLNETDGLGGGIFVYGSRVTAQGFDSGVLLTNVTVSNNVSIATGDGEGGTRPYGGGGVYVQDGFLYTAHATFAENSVFDGYRHIQNGAGIVAFTNSGVYPGARIQLANTLIADGCSLTNAKVYRNGVNVERTNTCGLNPMVDRVNVDPRIYPIDVNGGPFTTLTHAIALNSPALDAADAQVCNMTTSQRDQRGVARPQGPGCDIGAYERAPTDRPLGQPLAWDRTGRPRHNHSRVDPAELIEAVLGSLDDRDDEERSFSGQHDQEERVPQDSPDVPYDWGLQVR
jgi:hypothetical protein